MNIRTLHIHTFLICGLLLCGLPAYAQSPSIFLDTSVRLDARQSAPASEREDALSTSSPDTPTTTGEVAPAEGEAEAPAEATSSVPDQQEPSAEQEQEEGAVEPAAPELQEEEARSVPPVIGSSSPPPTNPYDTGAPLGVLQTALLLALSGTSGVAGMLLLKRPAEGRLGVRPVTPARSGRYRTAAPEHY